MKKTRTLIATGLLGICFALPLAAQQASEESKVEENLVTRQFRLEYIGAEMAANVLRGIFAMRNMAPIGESTVVVSDQLVRIERAAEVLAMLDRSPGAYAAEVLLYQVPWNLGAAELTLSEYLAELGNGGVLKDRQTLTAFGGENMFWDSGHGGSAPCSQVKVELAVQSSDPEQLSLGYSIRGASGSKLQGSTPIVSEQQLVLNAGALTAFSDQARKLQTDEGSRKSGDTVAKKESQEAHCLVAVTLSVLQDPDPVDESAIELNWSR